VTTARWQRLVSSRRLKALQGRPSLSLVRPPESKKREQEDPSLDPAASSWKRSWSIMGFTVGRYSLPTRASVDPQTTIRLQHQHFKPAMVVSYKNYKSMKSRQLSLSVHPQPSQCYGLAMELRSYVAAAGDKQQTFLKFVLSRPSTQQRASDKETSSRTS
jgi:hypothetical protein